MITLNDVDADPVSNDLEGIHQEIEEPQRPGNMAPQLEIA